MKTMTVQTEIGSDGTLRIELPCNLPSGPAEVIVVIQPQATASGGSEPASLVGILTDEFPADFDAIAEIRALRRRSTENAVDPVLVASPNVDTLW